jgi:hypothetical protein
VNSDSATRSKTRASGKFRIPVSESVWRTDRTSRIISLSYQSVKRFTQFIQYKPHAAQFIGWTLVASEEGGPERSLWLEADGRSRELGADAQSLWAPDMTGCLFDPQRLLPSGYLYDYVHGYSKRTMLGGYLPAADIGVWNPEYKTGYEIMMVLPSDADAQPIARVRAMVPDSGGDDLIPDGDTGAPQKPSAGESVDRYWNGSAADFFSAAVSVWNRWHPFFDDGMQVEIPDEWLLQAARPFPAPGNFRPADARHEY